MKAKIRKHRYICLLLVLILVAFLTAGVLFAQNFFDENRAVHINAASIEPSTLIIGTHLIHLSALTDDLYEIALQSAEDSGQNKIYYKSELGGNAWFDITTAASLADITTEGTPVTDEEIGELFFTHHTKSDKVTYDLRTGQPVNIFNIHDPYDIENLEEMTPLKMQYDKILELMGADAFTERIDKIWKTEIEEPPLTSDVKGLKKASEYDEYLTALEGYLGYLRENDGSSSELDKVNNAMEAVDASRRYLVYATLYPILDSYLEEISTGKSIMPALTENEEPVVVESEIGSAELISSAAESLGKVQGAMINHAGKMLAEGTTVISSAEFDFMNSLIEHAKERDYNACNNDVRNLINLDNIQNDNITDITFELETLEKALLPEATERFAAMLRQGESAQYKAEKINNSAEALLNRFVEEYENNTNTVRNELEFLIKAKTTRMDANGGLQYLAELLVKVSESYSVIIPAGDFAESANASVEAHIVFLTNLSRELELASDGNELDKLLLEKEELQTKRLTALDNNNLKKASELEALLKELEEKIRISEEETARKIAELQKLIDSLEDGSVEKTAAQVELNTLQNGLSDGSLAAMVSEMKKNGDAEGLATLLATDPEIVLPALQSVYNDLLLNGGDPDTIDMIEQAILENPNALREELSTVQIRNIAKDWMAEKENKGAGNSSGDNLLSAGGGISESDAKTAVAAAIGIARYADELGNKKAAQVASAMLQEQQNLGNPMVYNAIKDGTGEYVPLSAIQAITGRRYVWNKNSSLGVLAKGNDYYGFTVYSNIVTRDRDGKKSEKMPRNAKYQNGIYIPEEYASKVFDVEGAYVTGTDFGCAYDEKIQELSDELFNKLLEG